jgi:hypothetical protein
MTLQVGERIKYVVERNPHKSSAPVGTYDGVVLERDDHCGSVETEDGKFAGVIFTIKCDDGRVVTTSMFADLERPLS